MNKFKVGDKVRYIGNDHESHPAWYPAVGTTGVIIGEVTDENCYIRWKAGSTSCNDEHYCCNLDIELVEKNEMTNEEIWQMLENKMRKNGLVSKVNIINSHVDDYPDNEMEIIKAYYEEDVHNAIALAYKVGYLRSQKGRPFKFSEKKEKKQGGHWVPVDPNNLPKEGSRVRYSRADISYNDSYIKLYDTGVVEYRSNAFCKEFGVKLDKERRKGCDWVFFGGSEDAIDMWVEDDE